jgi:hypothetical protein
MRFSAAAFLSTLRKLRICKQPFVLFSFCPSHFSQLVRLLRASPSRECVREDVLPIGSVQLRRIEDFFNHLFVELSAESRITHVSGFKFVKELMTNPKTSLFLFFDRLLFLMTR